MAKKVVYFYIFYIFYEGFNFTRKEWEEGKKG